MSTYRPEEDPIAIFGKPLAPMRLRVYKARWWHRFTRRHRYSVAIFGRPVDRAWLNASIGDPFDGDE